MNGYKKYIITWIEEHKKIIYATSEDNALIDAMISSGDYTCIKSKNFKREK